MKYCALLRGINVGGKKKVDMKKLKACFESLGYANVSTYINSGNVLFETTKKKEEKIVSAIERAIKKEFGFKVRVVVRTAQNIRKVAHAIPRTWENNAEQKTDILFLWDAFANKKSVDLLQAKKGIDTVKYVDGALLWNVMRKDYAKSAMNNFIGTELYNNMTARNVNTVRKLASLLEE